LGPSAAQQLEPTSYDASPEDPPQQNKTQPTSSSDRYLHTVVDGALSVREGHSLSQKVEDEILGALPHVAEVLVHVEPQEELTTKTQQEYLVP
jgi:divalent metal cation (Fe/Co/Zn/Cd) transporter